MVLDAMKKFVSKADNKTYVKIYSGDCYATKEPEEVMVTILGSCIAACIRDPQLNIGGMNHFLLPATDGEVTSYTMSRYGSFAMEQLINSIIKMGGVKSRLEVKLFGGANVSATSALIGSKNVEFIKKFCKEENLNVVAEHLGGTQARKVQFCPGNGVAMMKLVTSVEQENVVQEEMVYSKKVVVQEDKGGSVDLF
ncbi:MAG: chemoreceptor glutamine deamidase CheD [Alphaproteobacteria bacterium]|nr:chemoreceptor glutamine deamidase CheD [Alphaproteobacteria bacterium]OJV13685.1 MAG: hypothetical protein BGO27_00740 [Alphaproteobacteria bacterium 33-17]